MTSARSRGVAPVLVLLGLFLGGCAADPAPGPGPGPSVSGDGFAGLTVLQSSITDVQRGLGLAAPFSAAQTEHCTLHVWQETGLAVATTDAGTVLAFVVANPDAVTPQGISVGSTSAELDAAYGSALAVHRRVSPAGGEVVIVQDGAPDDGNHLAFDLDADGIVARVRIGALPWVGYTDYCSDQARRPQDTGWPL